MVPIVVNSPSYSVSFITKDGGLLAFTKFVTDININTTCVEMINAFQITFEVREIDKQSGHNIYDIIEPMSYCEVKLSGTGGKLTTVIRGFVTDITKRTDLRGQYPMESITVSGQNYGKVIKDTFITYILGANSDIEFTSQATRVPLLFGYDTKGLDLLDGSTTPADAILFLIQNIVLRNFDLVKQFIEDRRGKPGKDHTLNATQGQIYANTKVSDFICQKDDDSVINGGNAYIMGSIDATGVNGNRGDDKLNLSVVDPSAATQITSIYQLMEEWAGKPWNELYVDDRPDAAYLVFRPVPYRNRYGKFIGFTRTDIGAINIQSSEVISYEMNRTDADVFNYYFTDDTYGRASASFESIMMSSPNNGNPIFVKGSSDNLFGTTDQKTTPYDKFVPADLDLIDYSRMEIYGYRPLKVVFKYISGQGADLSLQSILLNKILFYAFEQNSQYEQGFISIKGRTDIRPGMYINCALDRFQPYPDWYYVESLQHSVQPVGGTFITTLNVVRGEAHLRKFQEGFISDSF